MLEKFTLLPIFVFFFSFFLSFKYYYARSSVHGVRVFFNGSHLNNTYTFQWNDLMNETYWHTQKNELSNASVYKWPWPFLWKFGSFFGHSWTCIEIFYFRWIFRNLVKCSEFIWTLSKTFFQSNIYLFLSLFFSLQFHPYSIVGWFEWEPVHFGGRSIICMHLSG